MPTAKTIGSITTLSLLLTTPLTTPAAWADLKIVSTVTVTGGTVTSPPDGTTTYTTLYKGRKARVESSEGMVVLYDRDADKVYTLNPGQKTYYVRSFKDTLKVGNELPEPLNDRMSVSTHIDLDAVKSGDSSASRAIAGRDATQYSLFSTISLSPRETEPFASGRGGGGGMSGGGGMGRGGGGMGRGGGGGFGMPGGGGPGGGGPGGGPSGGGSGGRSRQRSGPTSQTSLSGNYWVADAEKILPNGKKDEKEMALALVGQTLPPGSPALEGVADRLAKKHLLPLESRVSVRTGSASTSQGTTATSTPPQALVVQMQVASLDSSVALADDLFRLPDGYDRIEPPLPQASLGGQSSGSQSGPPSGPPPAP